jgi:hypothetical protein
MGEMQLVTGGLKENEQVHGKCLETICSHPHALLRSQKRNYVTNYTFVCFHFTTYLGRNMEPAVRRAFPPVGWHKRVEHPLHITTVWAWL